MVHLYQILMKLLNHNFENLVYYIDFTYGLHLHCKCYFKIELFNIYELTDGEV